MQDRSIITMKHSQKVANKRSIGMEIHDLRWTWIATMPLSVRYSKLELIVWALVKRDLLPAAKMYPRDSNFWWHKICADLGDFLDRWCHTSTYMYTVSHKNVLLYFPCFLMNFYCATQTCVAEQATGHWNWPMTHRPIWYVTHDPSDMTHDP